MPLSYAIHRRTALAGLGLLALTRRALALDPLSGPLVEVNPPAVPPAFSFTTEAGARQTLADYRGKGVVLNIWATWCGPCVAEMPALDALAPRAAALGIAVLPVSVDAQGLPAVREFYRTHHIQSLPILLSPDGDIARAFKVDGIPASFIFDRAGRITAHLEGAVQWDTSSALATIARLVGPDQKSFRPPIPA
jgi:thiol-disulfide isomerase/thioredoxin